MQKLFYESSLGHELIQRRNWPAPLKEWDSKEKQELVKLAKGMDFLEIGCGDGSVLKAVAKVAKSVTGIDKSASMVSAAKNNLKDLQIAVLKQNVKKLSFKDKSFDIIVCAVNTFGNVSPIEKSQGLKEMYRVLRPKGIIWITVYAENGFNCQLDHYKKIGLTGIKVSPNFVTTNEGFKSERFSPEKIRKILCAASLNGEIKRFNEVSYLFTIKKN